MLNLIKTNFLLVLTILAFRAFLSWFWLRTQGKKVRPGSETLNQYIYLTISAAQLVQAGEQLGNDTSLHLSLGNLTLTQENSLKLDHLHRK